MSASTTRAALVTGIAGGIGTAIGQALREDGWYVIGLDLFAPDNEKACDRFLKGDLARIGSLEEEGLAFASRLAQELEKSPLSLLVNNAAVQRLGRCDELSWEDWLETLFVNLSAPFALARLLAPQLRAARGLIINIGSVHARATKPGFSAYATSKAALHGLTRALAIDLAPQVRVLTLAPAAVDTPMLAAGFQGARDKLAALNTTHPLGRIARPEEVGQAVRFLASDAGAAFMAGSTMWLDGGILARLHDPI